MPDDELYLTPDRTPDNLKEYLLPQLLADGRYAAIKSQFFNAKIIICDEDSIHEFW